MNKSLHISTSLDQPALLEDMIEKLAYRRVDIGYGKEKLAGGRKALETSSTETYVSGTLATIVDNGRLNIGATEPVEYQTMCANG